MAPARRRDAEEVAVRRIVACFAPGSPASPEAVARLAKEMRTELLGLFIEDDALLRLAALPFAAEVGFPSAARRPLDLAGMERSLRHHADFIRKALAAALDPGSHAWSFRVARGSPAASVAAALAEGYAPSLLIPPGASPRAQRQVVRTPPVTAEQLRAIMGGTRPVLILPE